MNWDDARIPCRQHDSLRGARKGWALLGACIALGCTGSPGPVPHLTETGEFWAEGYWRYDPDQSYELTEARLREAAKEAGTEVPDATLKDAFWILQKTEGEMNLSAYTKADLRLTSPTGPHSEKESETINGTWRPRANGCEFEVDFPASAAGERLFFERENDYRLRIQRGNLWHVWGFERSRR